MPGDLTIETFTLSPKSKPWPTTELIFDVRSDGSGPTLFKGPNKALVQNGGIVKYEVTMRYLDAKWKVWDQTAGTTVKNC